MKINRDDVTTLAINRLHQLSSSRSTPPEYEEPQANFVDPPVTGLRPVAALGLGFVIVIALFAWSHRSTPAVQTTTVSQGLSLGTPVTQTEIVVDVEGEVNKPGLVHLPMGSRMADAIAAAGGIMPGVDGTTINLAARLDDGQLIVVGQVTNAAGTQDSRVSLNQGTAADFDSLPGVGPVLASRIVAFRDQHNHFTSVDQLQEVPGIGPKVFATLKPLIKL